MLPLIAVLVVLAGAACLALGRMGAAAVSRAQAVTAADAAALAGAAAGKDAAMAAAGWNGGRLVGYEELGADTRVSVVLGGARATARARRSSALDASLAGDASSGGLAPAMKAALSRAGGLLGGPVPITSGYRSRAEQAALFAHRGSNPYPVAAPGTSRHELGLAVDVPLSFVSRLLSVSARVGLCQPFPRTDPVHFELCAHRLP